MVLDGLVFDEWLQDSWLVLAENYACCLDAFGRIFAADLIPSVDNIAIADRVLTTSAFDNYGLTLYTTDGISKTYEVDPNTPGWENSRDAIDKIYTSVTIGTNKNDISKRVVKYKLNSKGHITSLQLLNAIKGDADFRAATRSVGAVRMNENTKVIDAIAYVDHYQQISDLSIAGVNNFVDNQRYVVYGYGTRFSDGAYPFVLVTAGEGKYTEDTRIAVLASDPGLSYINQEDGVPVVMYTMDLLTADQDTPENFTAKNAILMMDGEQIDFETLKKGDLVVYALNANGQIKDMDVIFKADSYAVSGGYNTLASQLLTAGDHSDMLCLPTGTAKWTTEWKPVNSSDTPAQIVIGPIVEKTSNAFSIGKIANGTIENYTGPYTNLGKIETEDGGILTISINGGTRVYGYDYGAPSRSSLFIGTTGDLLKCAFSRSELLEDQTVIPWNNLDKVNGVPAGMNIAIAKVVNGVRKMYLSI